MDDKKGVINTFTFRTINQGYQELVKKLLHQPDDYQKVDLPGSGQGRLINKKSRFHLRNVHAVFTHPEEFEEFKVAGEKRTKLMNNYMNRERMLFDQGVINADEMGKISVIWKKIENPDGTINANYGYMVYHLKDAGNPAYSSEMMTQWEWCQNRLSENLHTLQAIMHFNRPKDQYVDNLDQPCTVFTQFTVVDGRLNFHSFMRSNDVIYGMPYNLAYFKVLLDRMLDWLNSECGANLKHGCIYHNVTSLHLYEDKKWIAEKIVGDN